MNTNFDYDFNFESKEYQISRNKLRQKVAKSRAKRAKKAMVFKKIQKYIALGLMAVAVVGTITSAKNFKVAAVRVATNEEVQTLFAPHNTDSDTILVASEKEIVAEEAAIETVVQEEAIDEVVAEEVTVETLTEVSAPEYITEAETVAQEEVIVEEVIVEENIAEEVVTESTTEENILGDDLLIYDKAAEILYNTTAEDITLVTTKASDVMFKSQGGDKSEFSPWEELFGANVYRYPGLRFKIEAKINADRMSVVSGFNNDFYVVVDNIDREGIEYNISLDVDEIMEMISKNGKTPEETKAVIEKHGDFFKQVINDSKKDIENKMFGSYINGMKSDNEFYKALNKQLLDSLNHEYKVTVLGAEA